MKVSVKKTGKTTIKVVDPKEIPFWLRMTDGGEIKVNKVSFDFEKLCMYYLPDKDGKPKDLFIYWSYVDLYDEIYGSCNS